MKKLSITMKITIWYVVFLLVITAGFLGIMVYNGNSRASSMAKSRLTEAVVDASEEINATGENFIIDDDLNFYEDGVYISIYDEKGELIEGRRPGELTTYPKLNDKSIEKVKDEKDIVWYVYDSFFYMDNRAFWVRGIVKDFAEDSTFSFMLKISVASFPVLLIIAVIGGYVITRRAFRPVREILETVDDISRDGDLSRRISVSENEDGGSRDEIYRLGYIFNNMFDKLEKSFEQEKQFTSNVSHELRTPLAVIISQSDYAREDKDYREKALEVINREARRMSGLVNRLLTITRSDAGRLRPEMEKVNLSELCDMVAEQQTPTAEEKLISIHRKGEDDIWICGDESMLIRILLNLVENGIKYGKEKGNLWIETSRKDKGVFIKVIDDGIGIDVKDMDRIWERFYRVDATRREEGTGLGLAMVEALVRAHGGSVKVSSSLGRGSSFEVFLPEKNNKKKEAEDE